MSFAKLTSPSLLKDILSQSDVTLHKRYGQNFLVDENILHKIVQAVEPATRSILEIGPGAGTLTRALADAGGAVVAVEIDQRLQPVLKETLAGLAVEVVFADATKIQWSDIGVNPPNWFVVANLPYYITTELLINFLENGFERIVIMVQKEVADRILAKPGDKARGSLSAFVEYWTQASLITTVGRNAFYPRPEVDSAVLRLDRRPQPCVNATELFYIIRGSFQYRRKTMRAALGQHLGLPSSEIAKILESVSIDSSRRAETLSLDEFVKLTRSLDEKNLLGGINDGGDRSI